MIKMSNAAQPLTIVMSIIILTFLAAAYKKFAKSVRGRTFLDVICLRIPLIQQVVIYKNMTGFFHALALLIEGGMPLTKAIAIAKESIDNSRIKQKIGSFERDIRAGSSFAQIFADNDQWFGQDVVALIKVGQESGTLVQMLRHVAHRYQSKLLAVLNTLSSLFQPLLLLILGLLITCLIIALYTPIMNISSAV
jgi:type IV pilus assembly protein PilC